MRGGQHMMAWVRPPPPKLVVYEIKLAEIYLFVKMDFQIRNLAKIKATKNNFKIAEKGHYFAI